MKFILDKIFEDKSISKVFLVALLSNSLFIIAILGFFWIRQERKKFSQESKRIEQDFFDVQEKTLQHETQTLINYIENERRQARNLLKTEIRSRVYEAHAIATNLYNSYSNELSKDDLKSLISNALRSVRFNNGNGFFYINTLNGISVMDPENPGREGKNQLSLKDIYETPIIQSEIETVTTTGEGYTNYSWQNDDGQKIHPKISFVKIFEKFNWYIGCTQHVNSYRKGMQQKILDKITDLRFDNDFTIAVFSFDGTCLAHTQKNLVGKNLWNTEDDSKKKIIQEFISRGTDQEGGFIRYTDPFTQDESNTAQKLMYTKSYKDWQWVIGSGVQIDALNHAIQLKEQELQANVNNYISKAILILFLIGIIIVIFTKFIVKISQSGLNAFTKFYQNAVSSSLPIDTSQLHFKEFKTLGLLANQMIEKRKEAEHQLSIEVAYFEQLFENSPEAIAITDNKGKGLKINQQFTQIFGYTAKDIQNIAIDKLLANDLKREEAKKINVITAKGQLIEIETKRKCKNGKWIDVSIVGNPIVVDGKQIAIFGIYRDITQRKEYEKHLTEAKNRAEESDKLKSSFLANMSHEIRTPMNHILGFTDLLTSQHPNESEKQEYASLIKQSSANLLQLINNIIDLSKIESRQIKLKKEHICINQLLSALFQKYNAYKDEKNKNHLTLRVQEGASNNDCILYTDSKRMEQMLSNLIENAIKFTNNGFVDFGYQLCPENEIEFFVRDTGIGIRENFLHDIFKSFRQIDGSDTRCYEGTGLGLTISHRLADLLGGEITVKSEENVGTCFYIKFYHENQSHSRIIVENAYNWQGKKILVVDDEKNNYRLFKAKLKSTQAEVLWAKNGIDAISLCETKNIDLVLMDIQMPEMNGYEVTKTIKQINANIPIIGQTAFMQEEYTNRLIAAGCNDCLIKPISSKALFESINRQLN